ncbi:MAG: hypothetical protein KJO35_04830 [Gammaproteobacteria bacterium]|nr:hypothetical protein [Gammaproteobacteria bacterium]
MADRMKDAEDRMLESMFAAVPIADDGFSTRVVGKVRRRLWLRRLALPVAALVGGIIAIKPLTTLVTLIASLSMLLPQELLGTFVDFIPQAQTVVLGGMLLAVCLLGMRMLED